MCWWYTPRVAADQRKRLRFDPAVGGRAAYGPDLGRPGGAPGRWPVAAEAACAERVSARRKSEPPERVQGALTPGDEARSWFGTPPRRRGRTLPGRSPRSRTAEHPRVGGEDSERLGDECLTGGAPPRQRGGPGGDGGLRGARRGRGRSRAASSSGPRRFTPRNVRRYGVSVWCRVSPASGGRARDAIPTRRPDGGS